MTVRRLIACILLPCYLLACSTWKTQEASPQEVLAEQPDQVLVQLTDGFKVVLRQPAVSGDSIIGLENGEQRSIPLASVSALEVREPDMLLTTGAILGGLVVVAGVVVLIACAASSGTNLSC
jgi:hypothetical protein